MFWRGLLLCAFGFSLPAIGDLDTGDTGEARSGYSCAALSVLAVPIIGNLFRFESSSWKSTLECASLLLTAIINPFFWL
jgi:hypothetical protein